MATKFMDKVYTLHRRYDHVEILHASVNCSMRILFSIVGLLVVVAIIGVVAKKQLGATVNVPQMPGVSTTSGAAQGGTMAQTPQSTASQVKQSVEGMLQQPRPGLEEK